VRPGLDGRAFKRKQPGNQDSSLGTPVTRA